MRRCFFRRRRGTRGVATSASSCLSTLGESCSFDADSSDTTGSDGARRVCSTTTGSPGTTVAPATAGTGAGAGAGAPPRFTRECPSLGLPDSVAWGLSSLLQPSVPVCSPPSPDSCGAPWRLESAPPPRSDAEPDPVPMCIQNRYGDDFSCVSTGLSLAARCGHWDDSSRRPSCVFTLGGYRALPPGG